MSAERYKIYEQLGAGGSGAVYRAYDSQLKRWVAIKRLLSAEEATGQDPSVDELRREADTLASLRNSSIVTIYDVATDQEGLFIVMELLTGPDLSHTLAHGPLGMDDFKQLAEQTLEALLAAHELRILHRDIKPENIKVERLPGGRLQAKIIDFGLARAGLAARKQTESGGTVMGSIYYMAPEQLSRQPTDQRTDLYSLGCVLYETLSGRKAFDGKTVHEVIDKHLNDDITPLVSCCPHLPQWLTYWVMRLMAKDPAERPQTAQQAIEEFRAWEKLPPNPKAGQLSGYTPFYGYAQTPTTQAQPMVIYHTTGHHPSHITSYQVPVHHSTGHLVLSQPAPIAQQPITTNLKKKSSTAVAAKKSPPWLMLSLGAAALCIGAFFLFGNKSTPEKQTASMVSSTKPQQVQTGSAASSGAQKSSSENSSASAPSDIHPIEASLLSRPKADDQLFPTYRPFPILDNYRCMHYVAATTCRTYPQNESTSFDLTQNWNQFIAIWDDASAKGDNTPLVNLIPKVENSPKRVHWKQAYNNHPALKEGKTALDFRSHSGNKIAMKSLFGSQVQAFFPFGSDLSTREAGLTIIGCASIDASKVPMTILSLSSEDQKNVARLFINEKRNLVLGMHQDGQVAYATPPSSDTGEPFVFAVRWSKSMDARVNLYSTKHSFQQATKPADFTPDKALCELIIGATASNSKQSFQGLVGDLIVYSTALEDDELSILQKELFHEYFDSSTIAVGRPTAATALVETSKFFSAEKRVKYSSNWKIEASHTKIESELVKIFDGNLKTRWSSYWPQGSGMWLKVEFPQEIELAGIRLNTQTFPNDYPLTTMAEYQLLDNTWQPITQSKTGTTITDLPFFRPIRTRCIKILQTGNDPAKHWSISELNLFGP